MSVWWNNGKNQFWKLGGIICQGINAKNHFPMNRVYTGAWNPWKYLKTKDFQGPKFSQEELESPWESDIL